MTRIHLSFGRSNHELKAANLAQHAHALGSYADPSIIRAILRHHLTQPNMLGKGNLIVDSGAYTAFTKGQAINLEEYAAFCVQVTAAHAHQLNTLEFMNLDVIGHQERSTANFHALREEHGVNVTPVFTYGAALKELERLAERHPRIALGGLVPVALKTNMLNDWLTACFSVLHGSTTSIHLLGIAQERILTRYPVDSCDASSWSDVVRVPRKAHLREQYKGQPGDTWKPQMLLERIKEVQAVETRMRARTRNLTHATQNLLQ